MSKQLVLVTGGARAGKSDFAQRLALSFSQQRAGLDPVQSSKSRGAEAEVSGGGVLFVATAEAVDAEMEERIRRHRASRPAEWRTLEEPVKLPEAIRAALDHPESGKGYGVVLVDCLNLWVSNLLFQHEGEGWAGTESALVEAMGRLLDCYQTLEASFILVTNEVGLGLVPSHPLGRQFRDALGKVNQLVAARSDKVYLLVAGLPLEVKALSIGHLPGTELPRS